MKSGEDRLLFTLGGEFFCIDSSAVTRIIEKGRVFHLPLSPPSIAGVINLKGDLIPVINPASILNKHFSIKFIEQASALIVGRPLKLIGLPLPEKEKVFFVWKEDIPDSPLRKVKERYIAGVTTCNLLFPPPQGGRVRAGGKGTPYPVKILDWKRILQDIYE